MFAKIQNHLLAIWQVSRSIIFIYLMVAVCAGLLTLPDQAQDMIDEFGQQNILSDYFLLKSLAVCVWTSTLWQCSRLILMDTSEIDLVNNGPASQFWMLWIPRILSLIGGLILAFAFSKDGHGWHALVAAGYAFLTFSLLLGLEKFKRYRQPSKAVTGPTTFLQDLKELRQNRILSTFILTGVIFMAALFCLFLVPIFKNDFNAGSVFSAVYLALLGCSFYTGIGGLIIYFSNFKNRPIALLLGLYALLITSFNDNTEINQLDTRPANRSLIRSQFGRWVAARKAKPGETLPMVIIATEGGGIRGAVWTSQLLFELNNQIPEFDRHTFAISGVSGGGVGAMFYLAYRSDSLASPKDTVFNRSNLEAVLQTDFISPVIGGYLFNESLQMLWPTGIKSLDRTKRLEDSWSLAFTERFGKHDKKKTFEKPFTDLYSDTTHVEIPSILLNGTLAETGQKTIVSNLVIQGESSFKDVVDIFDLTERDMPYKTAATMCSRFPFVTTGGAFKRFRKSYVGIQSGHVTDGGYFDNTGMETAIQLVTTLLPAIDSLKAQCDVTIQPYVIFMKNSESVDLKEPDLTMAKTFNRGLGIPASSFYNPWERGSETRDETYKNLSPYTNPIIKYMALKLDYKKSAVNPEKARLPLGWSISDTATKHIKLIAQAVVRREVNQKPEFQQLRTQILTHKLSPQKPLDRSRVTAAIPYTRKRYRFQELAVSDSVRFTVLSRETYSSSKLEVKENQIYRIRALERQHWSDSFVETTPAGYDWNILAKIGGLRVVDAQCFALCATYNDVEDNAFVIGDQVKNVEIKHDGFLTFFANDVGDSYGNNKGTIQIEISRIK